MKLDHKYHNYNGFVIEAACKKLGTKVKHLGTFCIKGAYLPVTVFYSEEPDLSKGHKHYPFLVKDGDYIAVGAMDEEEFEKERYQTGTYCNHCETLIYSTMRHDYRPCKCEDEKKQIHVDGGKDYFKFSWGKEASFQHVKIDFKTGKLTPTEDANDKGDIAVDKKADEMIEEDKT